MKVKEKKLIDLKVLLSVQDITELSKKSRLFKAYGFSIDLIENQSDKGIQIITPHAKELSWLFFQLTYIFENDKALFTRLANTLQDGIHGTLSLKNLVDKLLESI